MRNDHPFPSTKRVHLASGGQAVINGALVSAREACTLEICAGAYVLTGKGRSPHSDPLRNPRDELYFSLLECSASEARFGDERFRLFALLSEVVAHDRTYEGQRECARCAAALMAGDAQEAVQSAARMASRELASRTAHAYEALNQLERSAPPFKQG